jgi:hypothetical protein
MNFSVAFLVGRDVNFVVEKYVGQSEQSQIAEKALKENVLRP